MSDCPIETDPEKLVTHLLRDILRQPDELQRAFDYLVTDAQSTVGEAAEVIRNARQVYVTGMGSSWHAALNAASLFHAGGLPVHTPDAAELLELDRLPANSAMIVISRTGRTVEIVNLLRKARRAGATVVGVTNSGDGPLAREAQIPVVVPVTFDHAVSVNTYSTLSAAAGALASAALGFFDGARVASLSRAIEATAGTLTAWQEQIAQTPWLAPGSTYYFLARRSSLGSCHEARLLWEEAAKWPATAMGTGNFRHGPQEIVAEKVRFGMWIDGRRMRPEDLAVARDLRQLGALVMLIGQDLPEGCGDLVFQLPHIDGEWQFLLDIIPAQLAAEQLARLSGVDCDSFRLCSYVIEDECGLLREDQSVPKGAG